MTSPTASSMPTQPATSYGGPCGEARAESERRCAEAERRARTAQEQQHKLREARAEHALVVQQLAADARVRDRRNLAEAKAAAQRQYREALGRATDNEMVQAAAATWLHALDQLNRDARVAGIRAEELTRRVTELDRALPHMELAADAARISAEAAQVACLEARRSLAECEERAQHGQAAGPLAAAVPPAAESAPPDAHAPLGADSPIHAFLRGDRQVILGLALRLGEETGLEAGRLQLLLLELRDAAAARALKAHALGYPVAHPFWAQFDNVGARRVAEGLASMGYRFDGRQGWVDSHAPGLRDLAQALSYSGYDPRSLRRPAGQQAIDELWQGTSVSVEEWLLREAPALELQAVIACLGPRAARLGELWDVWGRLRPLLAN